MKIISQVGLPHYSSLPHQPPETSFLPCTAEAVRQRSPPSTQLPALCLYAPAQTVSVEKPVTGY